MIKHVIENALVFLSHYLIKEILPKSQNETTLKVQPI